MPAPRMSFTIHIGKFATLPNFFDLYFPGMPPAFRISLEQTFCTIERRRHRHANIFEEYFSSALIDYAIASVYANILFTAAYS